MLQLLIILLMILQFIKAFTTDLKRIDYIIMFIIGAIAYIIIW